MKDIHPYAIKMKNDIHRKNTKMKRNLRWHHFLRIIVIVCIYEKENEKYLANDSEVIVRLRHGVPHLLQVRSEETQGVAQCRI